MTVFFRKRKPPYLERKLRLGGLTYRDLMANMLLLGVTGGGKTTVLKSLLYELFTDGWGAFVPAMKPGDADWIVKLVRECGRAKDLVLVDRSARVSTNFFLDITVPGLDPATQALIDADGFTGIADSINRTSNKGGDDAGGFWVQAARELTVNACMAVRLAGQVPTVRGLLDLVGSAAGSPDELTLPNQPRYLAGACGGTLRAAYGRTRGTPLEADYEAVSAYWHETHPRTDVRTRSGYVSRVLSAGGVLGRGLPAAVLGAERPTLDVHRALTGRIVVTDFPLGVYGAACAAINCGLKYIVQRAALARTVADDTPGFVLCLDEYPVVGGSGDEKFMALSRSSRCPFVLAAQGFESIRAIFPNEDEADVLMGNANIRAFVTPTPKSATELCESLGQRRVLLANGSVSAGGYESPMDLLLPPPGAGQASGGFSESLVPVLSPGDIRLRSGADGWVDLLVTVAGRSWGGLPYTVASVKRR